MPNRQEKRNRVVVIGAGLGGMAAAITCAARGASVTVFEKSDRVGGKCNILNTNGFTFDLGPSILLLPQIFRRLFKEANRNFDDYVRLVPIEVQWRNFFENGAVIDLFADRTKTSAHLNTLFPGSGKQFDSFYDYATRQFAIADRDFLQKGVDRPGQLIGPGSLMTLRSLDLLRTVHQSVSRFIKHKPLCDIFDYFIKYVGSSAYRAPGFMNLLAGAQFDHELWYVEGGIYNLAQALKTLTEELGVSVRISTEINRIATDGNCVCGVITTEGETIQADAVISNMEVVPAYKKLLPLPRKLWSKLDSYEPACSAVLLHLGVDRVYPQLAHHNFFYSKDQANYFKAVFEDYRLPDDPTVYVVAPTRTDPSKAPPGCDNIKILPHVPHLKNDRPWSRREYEQFADRVMVKLERMGLTDLRKHVFVKEFWTPYDIEKRYYSNEGSIYGVVTDRWKNFAFKAPKQSKYYRNLFFAGGSVNPGGGMPMVTLSGYHTGKLVMKHLSGRK